MQHLYNFRMSELEQWFSTLGQPKFRAKQVFEWLYQKRVSSIDEMTNLPKALRQQLKEASALTALSSVVDGLWFGNLAV